MATFQIGNHGSPGRPASRRAFELLGREERVERLEAEVQDLRKRLK